MKYIKILFVAFDDCISRHFIIQQLLKQIVIALHIKPDRLIYRFIRAGVAKLAQLIDGAFQIPAFTVIQNAVHVK